MATRKKVSTYPLPKTIGECADRMYELKIVKTEISKSLDKVKDEMNFIEEYVVQNLEKSNSRGVMGHTAKVSVTTEKVPTLKDSGAGWDDFCNYLIETKQFDLITRGLKGASFRERWEAGEDIPGVEPYTRVKVSLTKIPSK